MSEPTETTCAWLDEFLGGELSPQLRHRFEDHLTDCASCRHEIDAWLRLSQILTRATHELEVPGKTLRERVTRAENPAGPLQPSGAPRLRVTPPWRAVTIVCVCGLLAALLLVPPRVSQDSRKAGQPLVDGAPRDTRTPPAMVELPDDVIGVPIDIGDDSVTVVWLYPVVHSEAHPKE